MAHTQGKKHQTNLGRRAAREAKQSSSYMDAQRLLTAGNSAMDVEKKRFIKIGRPGYKITKIREPLLEEEGGGEVGGRMGMLFQINLPEIKEGVKPLYRFMSSFEQHVEPQNRAWQYLVVSKGQNIWYTRTFC